MRRFLIAMASLAFIGGVFQDKPGLPNKPEPTPVVSPVTLQPFNPIALPPLPQVECKPVEPCDVPECDKPEPAKPVKQVVATDPLTGINVTGPTVIMVSAKWCEPCQKFKQGPMPGEILSKGWSFVVDETETAKVSMYPTYRIYDGKRWVQVSGVLTGAKMQAAINPKPAVGPVRGVLQNATSYVPSDAYRARWQNYDGKSRMQHAVQDHGIDISGKSEAQVFREMDAYHDQYGGGHPVRTASTKRYSQPSMSSGCPSCPTQATARVQRSILPWR